MNALTKWIRRYIARHARPTPATLRAEIETIVRRTKPHSVLFDADRRHVTWKTRPRPEDVGYREVKTTW